MTVRILATLGFVAILAIVLAVTLFAFGFRPAGGIGSW